MSHRYVLWQPESQDGEHVKWKTIPDTPEAREGALKAGAMFFSYCTYDEPPLYSEDEEVDVFNRAVIRHADLKFDIDAHGNLEGAADSTRRLVARLVDECGVPERAIRLYYSGGKGFHILVPEYFLGPEAVQGDRFLPLIHEHIVENLREGIPFVDDGIYNMGRGRQFRIANVLRKNGRHKIEIRIEELNGDDDLGIAPLTLDDFDGMAKAPRFLPELNGFKHEASKKLRALYREGKIKAVESKIEEMKRPPINEEQVAELKKELPACIKQVLSMTDYGDMENMTFNRLMYSLIIPYFKTIGMEKDDAYGIVHDFIVDFTASSKSLEQREEHFDEQWARKPYAWKCGVMSAALRCNCTACPVKLKETVEAFESIKPTFLESARASRFLMSEPEPIKYLLKDSLPQGMVGLMAGKGGTCKTFLLLQMEMAVAGLSDSLDGLWEIESTGSVFSIHAEDPDNVLHQRSRDIVTAFQAFEDNPEDGLGDVKKWDNWYCATGVGEGWGLVSVDKGELLPSPKYLQLLNTVKSIPNLKLIVLDPLSRFDQVAQKVDINTQATFFITLMERLAKATGASVIVACHTNKASSASPDKSALTSMTQESVLGAAQYVNSSRWTLLLTTLNRPDLKLIKKTGNPAEFVAGKVVKKNNGRPEDIFYLQRTGGGVLRRVIAHPVPESKMEAFEQAKRLIMEVVQSGMKLTKNEIGKNYTGKWKMENKKITEQVVLAAGTELVTENYLMEVSETIRGKEVKYLFLGDNHFDPEDR